MEEIDKEIKAIGHYIGNRISSEKLDYEQKRSELNVKINSAVGRINDLERGWEKNAETLKESPNKTTMLIMAEARLEGLVLVKNIFLEELGS